MQVVRDAAERRSRIPPDAKPFINLASSLKTAGPTGRAAPLHGLIIHSDRQVASALEERLAQLGYSSIVHATSESQAGRSALQRKPDLVLVGDTLGEQPGIVAALRFRQRYGVPVVLIPTSGPLAAGPDADIAAAVAEATAEPSH